MRLLPSVPDRIKQVQYQLQGISEGLEASLPREFVRYIFGRKHVVAPTYFAASVRWIRIAGSNF